MVLLWKALCLLIYWIKGRVEEICSVALDVTAILRQK